VAEAEPAGEENLSRQCAGGVGGRTQPRHDAGGRWNPQAEVAEPGSNR